MKKQWLCVGIALLLTGCGSKAEMKEGEGTYKNTNGETTTAKVKLKDDKLTEVELDETVKDKNQTKKELGANYNMKQASAIKKEWNEQVDFFEKYVEKHGLDNIQMNGDGKAENNDIKSGCTISVDGFIKAIKEAQKNAK